MQCISEHFVEEGPKPEWFHPVIRVGVEVEAEAEAEDDATLE
jgi:hypothetical protein